MPLLRKVFKVIASKSRKHPGETNDRFAVLDDLLSHVVCYPLASQI